MSAITDKIFKEYRSGELYRKITSCNSNDEEKERINSLIVLCYSYQFEQNAEEEENILLTIGSWPKISHSKCRKVIMELPRRKKLDKPLRIPKIISTI